MEGLLKDQAWDDLLSANFGHPPYQHFILPDLHNSWTKHAYVTVPFTEEEAEEDNAVEFTQPVGGGAEILLHLSPSPAHLISPLADSAPACSKGPIPGLLRCHSLHPVPPALFKALVSKF